MTLYLLEWDNGLEFADHELVLLGVYTAARERDEAKVRYCRLSGLQWPFNRSGEFVTRELQADADLIPVHSKAAAVLASDPPAPVR